LLNAEISKPDVSKAEVLNPEISKPDVSKPQVSKADVSKPDASRLDSSNLDFLQTQSLELPADLLPQRHVVEPVTSPASQPSEPPLATGSLNEFGELTLLATGEWQAMQRSDTKSETKTDVAQAEAKSTTSDTAATKPAESPKAADLSGAETLSLISNPAADPSATEPTIKLAVLPEPPVESKRAANGK
jgi:hypothetical protein